MRFVTVELERAMGEATAAHPPFRPESWEGGVAFVELGRLDPVHVQNLAIFLESRFGLWISPTDLTADDFVAPGSIARLLNQARW